jgi:uncharacterized protein involved in exopolysaccharide biosynthesis
MKPEFEKYKASPTEVTTVRMPADLKAKLGVLATLESDSLTGLIIEGAARVLEDRENDPDYVSQRKQALEAQIAELRKQQELLDGFLSHDKS